jgi:hypothetical protein
VVRQVHRLGLCVICVHGCGGGVGGEMGDG